MRRADPDDDRPDALAYDGRRGEAFRAFRRDILAIARGAHPESQVTRFFSKSVFRTEGVTARI